MLLFRNLYIASLQRDSQNKPLLQVSSHTGYWLGLGLGEGSPITMLLASLNTAGIDPARTRLTMVEGGLYTSRTLRY